MKIGSIVQITNTGSYFPSWVDLARKWRLNYWKENRKPLRGAKGIVSHAEYSHPHRENILCVVINGYDYLISERGVDVVKRKRKRILERQEGETP